MTQAKMFDTAAHRLLDDLDTRHDQLLTELDALSARVDQVLSQYVQVRPDTTPATGKPSDQLRGDRYDGDHDNSDYDGGDHDDADESSESD